MFRGQSLPWVPACPATPMPHTDNSVLCKPNSLRPRPLPTVLTGPDAPTLRFWAGGVAGPAGWQASPGFGPGTYNQPLPL